MDGRGAWRGDLGFCHNVFVERLWRTVKYEHVYKRVYASVVLRSVWNLSANSLE